MVRTTLEEGTKVWFVGGRRLMVLYAYIQYYDSYDKMYRLRVPTMDDKTLSPENIFPCQKLARKEQRRISAKQTRIINEEF